jgi:hypothetical protein
MESHLFCHMRKGKKKKGAQWVQVESTAERACFSFSGAFKSYTTSWEGRPRRFPPNNEQAGRGLGGSQPGKCGQVHPQTTYMSPILYLLLVSLLLEHSLASNLICN